MLAVMASSKQEDSVPDSTQFREALLTLRSEFSTGHHAMLKAHCRADGRRLTPAQLAKAARYPKHNTANLHYNKLGKLIGEHLRFTPPMRKRNKDAIWANVLATGEAPSDDVCQPNFVWTLRPELAEALLSLPWGIIPPTPEE
jgi:hypothetical protein